MRKIIVSRAAAGALTVPCRSNGSPAGSRRPVSGSLLAAAVVVLGLAGAAPVMANTAPSMSTDGKDVGIAVEGADHSLLFFRAVNGSATWHKQTVAGTGTAFSAFSAPSMTTNGADVNIAAEGVNGSLDFYWQVTGSRTWSAEQVAGPGTTSSAPSIATDGNDVNIAAEGANGGLDFYWAVNGTQTWNPEQVAPPGTVG
jgi:hypothetical protein